MDVDEVEDTKKASPTDAPTDKGTEEVEDKKYVIKEWEFEVAKNKVWDEIMRTTKYKNFGTLINPKILQEFDRCHFSQMKYNARTWGKKPAYRAKLKKRCLNIFK